MIKTGKSDLLTYKIYETREQMGIAAAAEAALVIKALLSKKAR